MNFLRVEKAFDEAVNEGVFPGAVVLAANADTLVFERAFGFRSLLPTQGALQPETVFDLASLTKPLATTLAIVLLTHEREIRIDDRVTRFLPAFGACGKQLTTIRQLLTHTSGLPAWKPYYEEAIKIEAAGRKDFIASPDAKRWVTQFVQREAPLCAPGTQCVYSDLGFIALGELVEIVAGMPLDGFCRERIYRPLGLSNMGFIDITKFRTKEPEQRHECIAPTENCPWRKKILCGEVHDDNAYVMGGVAGHAGLFATARDVHRLLACLSRCLQGLDDFFPRAVLADFFTKDRSVTNSRFALGWDTPALEGSASGGAFSSRTIGHLGFTGTSIWWDLEKNCHIVLLTNRVHPTRKNDKIRNFRPHIHDLLMKAMFS
jgi:CubicO group peptidase (beta-lactamase class C family)